MLQSMTLNFWIGLPFLQSWAWVAHNLFCFFFLGDRAVSYLQHSSPLSCSPTQICQIPVPSLTDEPQISTGGWEVEHKVHCNQGRVNQQCPTNKEITVADVLQLQSNTLPHSLATWPDSQTASAMTRRTSCLCYEFSGRLPAPCAHWDEHTHTIRPPVLSSQ